MRRSLSFFLCLLIFFTSSFLPLCHAEEVKGKLDAVEKELEKPEKKNDRSSATAGDLAAESLAEIFLEFFMMGLVQTGANGFEGLHKELKSEWSPALPTVRVEPSYQYVKGGIHAFSGKAEAGYLIFGVDGEYSRYWEKASRASLDIWSAHGLLRTIFTKHFQINLALGAKSVRGGHNHTGFDIGLPFYIIFDKHFTLDCLPYVATVSGRGIYDLSGGLSYKWKFIGARAAYRAIFVGDETLHGLWVGIFFQW